jgi:parallel beta-helix repeat protein
VTGFGGSMVFLGGILRAGGECRLSSRPGLVVVRRRPGKTSQRYSAIVVRVLPVLLALVLAYGEPARAATYYVRTSGSDSNDGLSPATAFATISRAARQARGTGNAIVVGTGLYAEGMIKPVGGGSGKRLSVFFGDRRGEFTGDAPGEVIIDAKGEEKGFWLTDRQSVIVNGFTVTNASEEGIFVKDLSDNCVIANCVVYSNGGRGIRVRDSADVVVFNNLVYANGGTGIEFEGEGSLKRPLIGSPRGVVINNTAYRNGVDGVRVEDDFPSEDITVLNNIITKNRGVGINLKEGSKEGFVGEWNLVSQNGQNAADDYNTLSYARGNLDLRVGPLLVQPAGSDGTLGGSGYEDDDFRLAEGSPAVDASPIKAKRLGLSGAWTRIDRRPDVGAVDLGFHFGNESDLVSKLRKTKKGPSWKASKSFRRYLPKLRRKHKTCDKRVAAASEKADMFGRGPCVNRRREDRLARSCGSAVYEICR